MGKKKPFQPTEKFKNYSLSTTKPFSSHAFYEQKVWTLPEQIFKKLNTISEFLDSLYPKLTDKTSRNIKLIIEKNLETLNEDLDLMQSSLHKTPFSFNSNKLKINKHSIDEMKKACDSLQTVSSYESEFKKLSKLKHALHELEQLIQPKSSEISKEKTRVKKKPKTSTAKTLQIDAKKNPKKKTSTPKSKSKSKVSKLKSKSPKAKSPVKKVTKTKSKRPKSTKKSLVAKTKITTKPKTKTSTKPKTKTSAKPKTKTSAKPKTKTSAKPKKK